MKEIGLPNILTLIFVVAKLVGLIDWSWWLVFLPTWGTLLVAIVFIGILIIVEHTIE